MNEFEELIREASTTDEGCVMAQKYPSKFTVGLIPIKLRKNGRERRVRRSTFDRMAALADKYRRSYLDNEINVEIISAYRLLCKNNNIDYRNIEKDVIFERNRK